MRTLTKLQATPEGDWLQTLRGRQFWVLEPKPEQIDVLEIALVLSRIPRFLGHTHACFPAYSVAQHSVLVSRLCPNFPLAGLLHDVHETYVGDITTPVKRSMHRSGRASLRTITEAIDMCISEVFKVPISQLWSDEVKRADLVALATEARDLMAAPPEPWGCLHGIEPAAEAITPVEAREAERMFLARFIELKSAG
jgi:5'-deoxynucleotidase YfbR-like HD superfamily hydrolase